MTPNLRSMLGTAFRWLANRAGYVAFKRAVMPYGVLPFWDINRLSLIWRGPVRIFFDVGANVGQTASAAMTAFPSARIFCFEPNEAAFNRLCARRLGLQVAAFQVALSNQNGEAPFFEYGAAGGDSLLNSLNPRHRFPVRHGYQSRETVVETTTLDQFCVAHGVAEIDVLKIDTEGHEINVLRGAKRMLDEGRIRFIYLEFNDVVGSAVQDASALCPIADFLRDFGFQLVATYTDYILPDNPVYVSANALFARAPQ